MNIKKPELLCPAGNLNRLYSAVDFGADAVYFAGAEFGMRKAAGNFSFDDMKKGIEYAHNKGVRVHVTCNTVPHNNEIAHLPEFLTNVNDLGADAIIASDLGTIRAVKKYAPNVELHASVQAGIVNYETADFFYELGAKRVVLARELSIEEIAEIRAKTPKELEIECFVHGAMCISYSGRCLLSSYMTGRDANRGECPQPCRWSYSLMEEKRPGQFFDITDTEKGTYILNANDLCMAEHIDDLVKAGVDSFKIEGRAKSDYYVSVVANAYRGAIDSYFENPNSYPESWVMEELNKISHRTYSTGFYYGKPQNAQTYDSAGYERDYSVGAVVKGYEDGKIVAVLKNKFLKGQQFDCLEAGSCPYVFTADHIFNEKNEEIESAPHPMMIVKIPCEKEFKIGSMLRMKNE